MATTIASLRYEDRQSLEHETEIVSLVDPAQLPCYVREIFVSSEAHREVPPFRGRLVGYATLVADAPSLAGSDVFRRRVFWLKAHDPYDARRPPVEAVDPLSVKPRRLGRLTERMWGGAAPARAGGRKFAAAPGPDADWPYG